MRTVGQILRFEYQNDRNEEKAGPGALESSRPARRGQGLQSGAGGGEGEKRGASRGRRRRPPG